MHPHHFSYKGQRVQSGHLSAVQKTLTSCTVTNVRLAQSRWTTMKRWQFSPFCSALLQTSPHNMLVGTLQHPCSSPSPQLLSDPVSSSLTGREYNVCVWREHDIQYVCDMCFKAVKHDVLHTLTICFLKPFFLFTLYLVKMPCEMVDNWNKWVGRAAKVTEAKKQLHSYAGMCVCARLRLRERKRRPTTHHHLLHSFRLNQTTPSYHSRLGQTL